MLSRRIVAVVGLAALLAGACSKGSVKSSGSNGKVTSPPGATGYHPVFDRSQFRATVDNSWFPLKPGTILVYAGTKDEKKAREIYRVTSDTKVIDGVPCVVVHDSLYLNGSLAEDTLDYYTQDGHGNVWYFGEDTKQLDPSGKVTGTAGTWRSGVDGAQPGIFMEAHPVIGHSFRQEYYKGHAEDQFSMVSLTAAVTVPHGSFQDALLTKEWTALDPGIIDHKYWVRGIGEVLEQSVTGSLERLQLVSVTNG
jgi:hypothetical protein